MLHYRRRGTGPTLVLQHGFLGGSAYWAEQFNAFPDFDIVAPDLPGFAGSVAEPARKTVEGMVEAVVDLLDTLRVERCHLLGHSMGGMVAQQLALDHPERIDRLVLYGTAAIGDSPSRFEPLATSAARIRAEPFDATVSKIVSSWFVDGSAARSYRLCHETASRADPAAAAQALLALADWDIRARLKALRIPTLVVCGDRDRNTGPQQAYELWKSLGDSRLCILPRCAHNVHLENPRLFNHALRDFLLEPAR